MLTHTPDHMFPGYSVAEVPAARRGAAGQGLLLAVKYSPVYVVQDHTSDHSTLSVRLHPTSGAQPLVLGVCYLPPAGSPQLSQISLSDCLDGLKAAALADPGSLMVFDGDVNAHVHPSNTHGRALLAAYVDAGLQVCTGILLGDQPAQHSLRPTRRTQATRPDHMLASPQAFPLFLAVHVNQLQPGSDHWPLEAQLELPWQTPAPVPCTGTPIMLRRWQPAARASYVAALQDHPALAASLAAAGRGDPTGSLKELYTAIYTAATASGMPARAVRQGIAARRQHQPFYDTECQEMKRAVRRASPSGRRRLERQYHLLVRRKARTYRLTQLRALLAGACLQQRRFWLTLKRPGTRLQAGLLSTQAWDGFMQQAAHLPLPAGLYLPAAAYPTHPLPPAEALNQSICQSEIHAALRRLHNGRVSGPAGLPAELLRYAQAESQPSQQPQPQHVLAPVLAAALDSMFQTGCVPAEFNLSLVTPVHKRGDQRDTANYRAIAVAEPIMRLYASVLNQRLLDFTEQHDLRAPS